MTSALTREWGGEVEWDATDFRRVTGLASVLSPYKRDRRVLVTVPRWAARVAKMLLTTTACGVLQTELVLLWCALSEAWPGERTFERAAAVDAAVALVEAPVGLALMRARAVRELVGLSDEVWLRPSRTRAEKEAIKAGWRAAMGPGSSDYVLWGSWGENAYGVWPHNTLLRRAMLPGRKGGAARAPGWAVSFVERVAPFVVSDTLERKTGPDVHPQDPRNVFVNDVGQLIALLKHFSVKEGARRAEAVLSALLLGGGGRAVCAMRAAWAAEESAGSPPSGDNTSAITR